MTPETLPPHLIAEAVSASAVLASQPWFDVDADGSVIVVHADDEPVVQPGVVADRVIALGEARLIVDRNDTTYLDVALPWLLDAARVVTAALDVRGAQYKTDVFHVIVSGQFRTLVGVITHLAPELPRIVYDWSAE